VKNHESSNKKREKKIRGIEAQPLAVLGYYFCTKQGGVKKGGGLRRRQQIRKKKKKLQTKKKKKTNPEYDSNKK